MKATALTRIHEIEVENTVAALLEHGHERVDTFYTTTAEWPGRTEFLFSGQKGRLAVADRQLRLYRLEKSLTEELMTSPHGSKPAGSWEEIDVPVPAGHNGHTALLRQFAHAVRSGNQSDLVATGEDGLHALELANAMVLSSFRDQTVTMPLDRGAYDTLLDELKQKAAAGELPKRHRDGLPGQNETLLATLPEGV